MLKNKGDIKYSTTQYIRNLICRETINHDPKNKAIFADLKNKAH